MHFDAPLSTFFCLARWLSSSFRARFSSSSTRARDTRQRRGTRTHRHRSSRKKEREKRGEERERFSFFCSGREIEKGFRRRRVRRSGGGGEEKKNQLNSRLSSFSSLFLFSSLPLPPFSLPAKKRENGVPCRQGPSLFVERERTSKRA